ncbi:MAG: RagB/SusD family nutrient uptake outer membrane protein [Cytophagales bacterium]|nr:RagB/SusD family nutrient uptake outer membrane protein [Cytophagales bacterium]
MKIPKIVIYGLLLTSFIWSCQGFVEIDPPETALVGNTVFTSDATATAALTGIYNRLMTSSNLFANGTRSFTLLAGLSADELRNHSTNQDQIEFYFNEITVTNDFVFEIWRELYRYIYAANSVIEGLANSEGTSSSVKRQLEGEAKFIRAFFNFYLVNMFGDIPVITETDHQLNNVLSRTSVTAAYDQIVSDLTDAQNLLAEDYVSNGSRLRPNRSTATALLARVYLFNEDWNNAEIQATAVLDNPLYNLEGDLNNVFIKESQETIWQLQATRARINTYDGFYFVLTRTPNRVSLNSEILSVFEVGDNRQLNWISSVTPDTETFYFPFKYKVRFSATDGPILEHLVVFRLAEQYLIRAEARLQLGNVTGATQDINVIRNRSGLGNVTSIDLAGIEQERRIELFSEWGHRWLDLKRTKRADAVLAPIKSSWQSTDVLFPIPQEEIESNPNLIPQNPGY